MDRDKFSMVEPEKMGRRNWLLWCYYDFEQRTQSKITNRFTGGPPQEKSSVLTHPSTDGINTHVTQNKRPNTKHDN